MTINQILDILTTKYQNGDIKSLPAIERLRYKLVELKVFWGGNTQIENEQEVLRIIETGTDNFNTD